MVSVFASTLRTAYERKPTAVKTMVMMATTTEIELEELNICGCSMDGWVGRIGRMISKAKIAEPIGNEVSRIGGFHGGV